MSRRLLIGLSGGTAALRIAKPGKDAASTSPDDLMVSPDFFSTQPYMAGSGTYPLTSSITHNLGYIPVIHVFGTMINGSYRAIVYADTSKMYFGDKSNSSSYTATCSWYIMKTMLAAS